MSVGENLWPIQQASENSLPTMKCRVATLLLFIIVARGATSPSAVSLGVAELLAEVTALGPVTEGPGPEPARVASLAPLPGFNSYYRVVLGHALGSTSQNAKASGIFEYWPLQDRVVWRLTIRDFVEFTGAHLHYADLAAGNPIVVDLVPSYEVAMSASTVGNTAGEFLSPTSYKEKTWTGVFGAEQLATHGISTIQEFFNTWVLSGIIDISVHGPGEVTELIAYLPP